MSLDFFAITMMTLMLKDDTQQSRTAATYVAQSYYVQSGLNKTVDPILESVDKKYLPDVARKAGMGLVFFYKIAKDNKAEFSWSF